jgi:hypothetical protein
MIGLLFFFVFVFFVFFFLRVVDAFFLFLEFCWMSRICFEYVLAAMTSIRYGFGYILHTHTSRAGEINLARSLSLCVFCFSFFFLSLSLSVREAIARYTLLYKKKESLHGVRLERKAELVLFLFREVRDYFPGDAG